MKKRILSVLLAAAMVGTMLVGCGSSSSSKSSDDKKTESSDEKKVIKLGVRETQIRLIQLWMQSTLQDMK